MNNDDLLLTESEVAAFIGKSVQSLRLWRRQAKGPVFYKIGRTPKYHREDLALWMRANRIAPGGKPAAA
jgi:hypothetical protein